MLPEQYSHTLTENQNYYGDSFNSDIFLDIFADQLGTNPHGREYVSQVANNVLADITHAVDERTGRDMSKIDSVLDDLYSEAEADLLPGALKEWVSDIRDNPELRQQMADRRRAQLLIRQSLISRLRIRRALERVPADELLQYVESLEMAVFRADLINALVDSAQIEVPDYVPTFTSTCTRPEAPGGFADPTLAAIYRTIDTMGR